jgi:3-hydroxyisobutyrate dehydrogenase-like beta-hydroxyacid dehydrogenase
MTVGIVGLGKMGLPMGRHLLASNFRVLGYDVHQAALAKGAALGFETVESLAALGERCDVVLVVVGFENQVEDAVFGKDGLLTNPKKDLVIVISSTVSPTYMRGLAERVGNVALLDAPLCRGEVAAENGTLLVMAGGAAATFETCRPVFAAFADSIHYLGSAGAGQVGKMVNNLILWACISVNDEGLKLARELGVEQEPLRQALLKSSAQNWPLETLLMQRDMPWSEKDMTIVLAEADGAGISLPLCGSIKEVIKGIKIERGIIKPRLRAG